MDSMEEAFTVMYVAIGVVLLMVGVISGVLGQLVIAGVAMVCGTLLLVGVVRARVE